MRPVTNARVSLTYYLGRNKVGTAPKFKMHNVGTAPTFKIHNIGTQPLYDFFSFRIYDFSLHQFDRLALWRS